MIKIKNNLNLWEYEEYSPWYRLDKKIRLFFRKIKWMFQRAKHGYCDKDLWSLDWTLGNYIASSVNELANRTHGYPFQFASEEEWYEILDSISLNFYLATNHEAWKNRYDDDISYDKPYNKLNDEQKDYWDKWFNEESDIDTAMEVRRQEGFMLLSQWFTHLWD